MTWISPSVVLGLGALAVAGLAKRLVDEVGRLRRTGRRLERLEGGLIPLRVEVRRTRASIEQVTRR